MLIVDCDCHNEWHSADELLPYLEGWWVDCYQRGEHTGPPGAFPHAHRAWFHPEDFRRFDFKPQSKEEHYTKMREMHLDANNIDIAILTGEEGLEVSTLANPHYAAALARANNDWMVNDWLPLDDRFYGSLIIAPQDPALAAEEIRRIGEHPRMAQVLASHGSIMPYGDPFYHPIYQACEDVGLPFAMHLGGNGGINTMNFAGGNPRYYTEAHALLIQPAQTHLVSLLINGVFDKFPNLKVGVIECGVAWVPSVLWRLDAEWKALRKEVPWVKRLPSETFRERVRFTTQPLETPPNRDHLFATLEAMHGQETLMFASDFPHWDQDEIAALKFPDGWAEDVFGGNALKFYSRVKQPAQRAA